METENRIGNSRAKLEKKHLDMVAANNLKVAGAGFQGDTNVLTLITKDEVRTSQTRDLVNRLFGGSGKKLFQEMFTAEDCLTDEERKEIYELLERKQKEYEEEKRRNGQL